MADKLLIVLSNSDPNEHSEVVAPLFQAAVAAAMEYEVEVIFTGRAAELARRGVAERLVGREGRSAYDYLKEAHAAGARFKACTQAVDVWRDELIPEVEETVGGAYLISEAMDADTVTLTY
jgi:predicted peroxiredoxin